MAGLPGAAGAQFSEYYWRGQLRAAVKYYSECSNSGASGTFCQRTEGGNAYPKDIPWGNSGAGLSGVCLAAVYSKLAVDPAGNDDAKGARCFMQRQLGFLTNHKCSTPGSKCSTAGSAGFSYFVGYGETFAHFPTHVHSRDAAGAAWSSNQRANDNTLCGALVSGPWTAPPGATDIFTDNRGKYTESEAGVDYSASAVCAFAGYADLAEGAFDHCAGTARTPFDGRGG